MHIDQSDWLSRIGKTINRIYNVLKLLLVHKLLISQIRNRRSEAISKIKRQKVISCGKGTINDQLSHTFIDRLFMRIV